ncbi:MAG: hypothetical protein QOI76_2992 [Frankiales bacterium]|nr:hypothetical protein [Frankiales bacterium]
MRRRTAPPRDESGSALILALAFLALFGLVVGVILQFSAVGFRTTVSVRSNAVNRAAANGALDGAVNSLTKTSNQLVGVAPFSAGCYNLPASSLQPAASVQCLARTGSGAGASGSTLNQPSFGVLTNTTNAAEGYVQAAGTASVVQGGVAADKAVSVGTGSTLAATFGAVVASTSCTTPATGVAPACQTGTVPADPGYGSTMATNTDTLVTASTAIGLATAPACPAGKVITLSPGIYQSAAALNALTTGGACAGSLLWFRPGLYYMNFADASDTWNLSDATTDVVAGTLTFALPASRPSSVPFPSGNGSTASGCDITKDGVIFIFGGDSRMNITGSKVQLCAPPNAGHQQVAVWGPSAGFTLNGTTVSVSVAPSGAWSGKCSGPGDVIDPLTGTLRHSAKVASAGNACSLPFTPSGLTSLLPSDAQSIGLTVSVAGSEQGSGYTQMTYTPPGGGTPVTKIFTPNCTNGCGSETAANSTLPPFSVVQLSDLNNMSLLLSVVNNNNQPITAWVDNPVLVLTYTEPMQPTSGVVAASNGSGYVPGSPTMAAIVRSSGTGRLSIHGTVYAPNAAVDISETSLTNDVVDRGIVARDVYLATTIGAGYTGPVVSIPPLTRNPRQLSLTASVGGVPLVRAEVQFTDPTGMVNGGVPHVLSWSGQ